MLFLEKYQNYLDFYTLINEATEEETILTRFLASIGPVQRFVENKFVYRFNNSELPEFSISISKHLVYSLIARSKFYGLNIVRQLYVQNQEKYIEQQNSLFNCPINFQNFPKSIDDYEISQQDLNVLINTCNRAIPYIQSRANIIINWFCEDKKRIHLETNYKFLLTKSHNIFTLTPHYQTIVFTTAYPTDKTTLPNKLGNVVLHGV